MELLVAYPNIRFRWYSTHSTPTVCRDLVLRRSGKAWRYSILSKSPGDGVDCQQALPQVSCMDFIESWYEQKLSLVSLSSQVRVRSAAESGGGSFKDRQQWQLIIGAVSSCDAWMAKWTHRWIERWSWLCLSPSLSFFLSLFLSFSLSLSLSLSLFLSFSPSLSRFLSLSLSLSLYLSIYLSISLTLSLSLCLSPSLFVFLSLPLSICLSISSVV